MNGIVIRDKPESPFPVAPVGLRAWVIASESKHTVMGVPFGVTPEAAKVGQPLTLDPCFELHDDMLINDPLSRPGRDPREGIQARQVVCCRRLLVPLRHFPSARSLDLIPTYLFRFYQLDETDLKVAHKYYGEALDQLIADIEGAHRGMSGDRVQLATAMPQIPPRGRT